VCCPTAFCQENVVAFTDDWSCLKQRFGQVDKDADEGGTRTGRLRMVVDGSQVVVDVGKGIVECVESDTQKR